MKWPRNLFWLGVMAGGGWFLAGLLYGQAAFNGNSSGYAWSEQGGWISFETTASYGVEVTDTYLDGYAWGEKVGYISLNRDTGTPDYGVTLTVDGTTGKLSGMAWGPQTGYIAFATSTTDYTNTTASNYGVTIDGETGVFSGYAWSEKLGWIKFSGNCTSGTAGICTGGDYGVTTTWRADVVAGVGGSLESATLDMGSTAAVINYVIWQGTQPTGTTVRFKLATSNNPDGPWSFVGSDGTMSSYYTPSGPGIPEKVRQEYHLHQRYLRYRIYLNSNAEETQSPTVTDVIINYSR